MNIFYHKDLFSTINLKKNLKYLIPDRNNANPIPL